MRQFDPEIEKTIREGYPLPTTLTGRLQARAEEWIYELNERDHWVFRIYDRVNELWASLFFRRLKRRASRIDVPYESSDGTQARFRFLTADDLDILADLFSRFDMKHLPPHGLDRAAAKAVLRRRSYLPFGIFAGDEFVGYVLLRLFLIRRAVTGIWALPTHHGRGLNIVPVVVTGKFVREEHLPDYVTIPLDNTPSLRGALVAGWKLVRRNRRFYVLLR